MRPRHACLGKFGRDNLCLPTTRSFNEAEARVPRKIASTRELFNIHQAASMRPRHACLGKYPASPCIRGSTRGFNEAEARVPRKMLLRRSFWKRTSGFNEAEARVPRKIKVLKFDAQGNPVASMRPRHACLGKYEDDQYPNKCKAASMRPRHACLGK